VSLFVVLLSIVVVAGAALLVFPWYSDHRALARAQKAEADAIRGVAPSTNPNQSKAAAEARERTEKLEAAEVRGDWKGLVEPAAYGALNSQCQGYVDTIVGLLDKPEDSAAFRARLAEAENRFTAANCIDRDGVAKADAAIDARRAAETREITCKQQRDAASGYRAMVAETVNDGPDKPGVIDEDKKSRRANLDENRKRLQEFEAYISANC
jgi:hypothetical protein